MRLCANQIIQPDRLPRYNRTPAVNPSRSPLFSTGLFLKRSLGDILSLASQEEITICNVKRTSRRLVLKEMHYVLLDTL